MSVLDAVEHDLERFDDSARRSSLAATAKALARELDGKNSATSKSMCAKSLIDVMRELRAHSPPRVEEDRVDEIAKRRERRLKRTAG